MQTIKQLLIVGTISCLLLVDCDWLVVVGVGLFGSVACWRWFIDHQTTLDHKTLRLTCCGPASAADLIINCYFYFSPSSFFCVLPLFKLLFESVFKR